MKKINIYNYKKFIPQGLMTLLQKKENVGLNNFLILVKNYMTEEERNILFQKIKKEEGVDLSRFQTEEETPLFKSIPSDKSESKTSNSKNIIIISEEIKKKKQLKKEREIEKKLPNQKIVTSEKEVSTKEKKISTEHQTIKQIDKGL